MTGQAITFNTSAGSDSGSGQPSSQTLAIPAGVLARDAILVLVNAFFGTSGATLALASTGTAPQLIAQNQANIGADFANGGCWWIPAASSDPGKILTASISTGTAFFALALVSYTGANLAAPIDVSGGVAVAGVGATLTYPAEVTGVANDWAVYLAAVDPSTSFTEPSGTTSRIMHVASGSGIIADITDSGGSVGGPGTAIGGSAIGKGSAGPGNCWFNGFTVGLAPPPALGGAYYPYHHRASTR